MPSVSESFMTPQPSMMGGGMDMGGMSSMTPQPSMMGGGIDMGGMGGMSTPTMMDMGGGSGMNDGMMGMKKMEGMKAYFFTGEGFHMLLQEVNIRSRQDRAWATAVAVLSGTLVPLVA